MSLAQKAISAMIWDFLGKGGLAFIRFAELALLVRLLGPTDFGIFTELLNYQALLVLLGALGFEGILSRFIPELKVQKKNNAIVSLIRQVTVIRLSVLILIGGSCFIFAQPLIQFFSREMSEVNSQYIFYVRLVAFLVISMGLQDLTRRILVIYFHQRTINLVEVVVYSIYLGVAVGVLLQGWGIAGVLIVKLISICIIFLIFFVFSIPYYRNQAESTSHFPTFKNRIISYGISFYILSITHYVLGKGSDIFILSTFADATQVTFYKIAFEFSFFTISFFELALMGGFILPFITEVYERGDIENVRKVYTGLFEFMYLFMIPIAVGGMILANELIELFIGTHSSEVVPLLILFYIHFSLAKIGVLNSNFMLAANQQNRLIASRVLFGGVNIMLNLFLVTTYQALGVVWGTLITGVLASIYETWCVHKIVRPKYPLRFLWKVVFASLIMGLIVWKSASLIEVSLFLKTFILIIMGGIIYIAMLVWLKPFSADNIMVLKQSKLPFKDHLFRLFSVKS